MSDTFVPVAAASVAPTNSPTPYVSQTSPIKATATAASWRSGNASGNAAPIRSHRASRGASTSNSTPSTKLIAGVART